MSFNSKIRWKKIKKVTEEILGKPAKIHLSTALIKLIAFCDVEETGETNILISAYKCKSEEQIVAAVSHELAHIKLTEIKHLAYNLHTTEFYSEQSEILKVFEEKMNLKNLNQVITEMENQN